MMSEKLNKVQAEIIDRLREHWEMGRVAVAHSVLQDGNECTIAPMPEMVKNVLAVVAFAYEIAPNEYGEGDRLNLAELSNIVYRILIDDQDGTLSLLRKKKYGK